MKLYALILTIVCFHLAVVFAGENKAHLSRRAVNKIVQETQVEKRSPDHVDVAGTRCPWINC
ncbi:hypothetical protein V8B55DRAFT_1538080 [Mucor lusitanicus]|uniref:Uncharacterized protein n=2 Tax=Mucor circinelloides f. lusitanicus TaxID=29924 RepID=A0A162QUL5_MUCCL|nr:hypothetical protein FB192DRAFT_1459867 [Mucor lusitanicus]OAD05800.1 hypothetical protein MUCCIDRAFT_106355 [Mucor lusitanicus CBS 277.49]